MEFNQALDKLKEVDQKVHALNHAEAIISWDAATGAPKNSVEGRAITLEVLTSETFKTLINDEFNDLLHTLEDKKDNLDPITLAKVKEYRDEYNRIAKIPAKEYSAYTGLRAKSSNAWEKAKANNDFKEFAPYLKEVVAYNKRFAEYRGFEGHPYNTLLGDYEKGYTTDDLDDFFGSLKETVVPLVKQINESDVKLKTDFLSKYYEKKTQLELSDKLLDIIGFNKDSGTLCESVHPFTTNFNKNDVRITTHVHKNNFTSNIFSTLHEGGHGLYEQNVRDDLNFSILCSGTSMGIHESQSRFYENLIGRSYAFCEYLYPTIQEMFPEQLSSITLDEYYLGINNVQPSLIRIEADELTYSLHVMIRYEIEKMLIDGSIKIEDLPEIWNQKYTDYLGVTPKNYSNGVLQDVHWSEGLLGYFPTYALGTAYASQLYNTMAKSIDFDKDLREGNISNINQWLIENIHKHGKMLSPKEILVSATGESLNVKHFTDYLSNKYSKIYNL